ncbi:hypothetical protein [Cesiribacter sp. SM1]|uniref:hypothetical protein n=1 Tax=Cesiribacter sp. SM1 TaxID=2861196 RepID=UPI001CD39CD2|nr:hypothetical protein [Cesiribacter sp. SM1]
MKRAVYLYLAILILLIQLSGNSLLVMHYSLNKASITEQFCENKERPELACEGSCHLQKQLKQLDENTADGNEKQLRVAADMVWICQQFCTVVLFSQPLVLKQFSTPYNSFYNSPWNRGFFHPPRQAAGV